MNVGEFCNRGVVTVERDESIIEAARQMRWNAAREVVVVDRAGGRRRPLGILSDRDIVVEELARESHLAKIPVGEAMTCELHLLHEDEDLGQVIEMLRSSRGRSLPVVNGLGDLVGLIALEDVTAFLREQLITLIEIQEEARSASAEGRDLSTGQERGAAASGRPLD